LFHPLVQTLAKGLGVAAVPLGVVACLAAPGLAGMSAPPWTVIGAVLFVLGTFLLGAGALVLEEKKTGLTAWLSWLRDLFVIAFAGGLGVSAYIQSDHSPIFLWGVVSLVGLTLLYTSLGYSLARQDWLLSAKESSWARLLVALERVVDRYTVAVFLAAAGALGVAAQVFVFVVIVFFAFTLVVANLRGAVTQTRSPVRTAFAYLLGLGVLIFLLQRMGMDAVGRSLTEVGAGFAFPLLAAIPTVVAPAFSLAPLLRGPVPAWSLIRITTIGAGLNQLLPMAGFGGEPYRIQALGRDVGVENASHALILSRIVNTLPGMGVASITLPLTVLLVPLSRGVSIAFVAAGVAFFLGFMAILTLAMSRTPTRVTRFLVQKLSGGGAIVASPLPKKQILKTLAWNLLGRLFVLVEMAVILRLVGLDAGLVEIVTINSFLALSEVVFFIPQGLGVHEVGFAGAFTVLGLPPHLAVSFGLIRRARQIVYSLLGVFLYVVTERGQARDAPPEEPARAAPKR